MKKHNVMKIFISYRREDSADVTGRIGDRLRDHFGKDHIFTDVDNIPLGVDFRTHLDNEVSQCDVLLAVIGRDWLSAKNSENELRLSDPADFVRIEIESALRRDIPVIPLLVRGASVPSSNQLPESIEELAFRNAQKIRPDPDFRNDTNRLVRSLIKHFEPNMHKQASTEPMIPERADESRLVTDRWQQRKFLWLGFASIFLFFMLYGWYIIAVKGYELTGFGDGREIGILAKPEPQQNGQPSEIGESSPSSATPVADFIAPDMVEIPAGTFMMGSANIYYEFARPIHQVTIPAFELARNELTWAEWQACENAGDCKHIERPDFFEEIDPSEQKRHPVVNVGIDNVNEYLTWISGRTGRSYRLPSEAEWEYATRGGTTTMHYWGDARDVKQANCDGCSSNMNFTPESTTPVGSFDANPFGLNDVHGNVAEWVADCFHDNYEGAPTDGSAWVHNCDEPINSRLVRGGSWGGDPDHMFAGSRAISENPNDNIGFRLARTFP